MLCCAVLCCRGQGRPSVRSFSLSGPAANTRTLALASLHPSLPSSTYLPTLPPPLPASFQPQLQLPPSPSPSFNLILCCKTAPPVRSCSPDQPTLELPSHHETNTTTQTVTIRPILTCPRCYTIYTIPAYTTIPLSHTALYQSSLPPYYLSMLVAVYDTPESKSVAPLLSINHHPVCRGRQSSPQRLSHQSKLPSHPLLLCPNPLLRDLRSPCPCAALQTPPRRVRSTPTLHSSSSASPRHLGPRLTSSSSLARQTCARRFRIDS